MKSRFRQYIQHLIWMTGLVQVNDLLLEKQFMDLQATSSNPFNSFGQGGFSQNDEDGLLREILRRLGADSKFFIEFGVGNGLENNSLSLILDGWSGYWYGGQDLEIEITEASQLIFHKCWIDTNYLKDRVIPEIQFKKIDVLSLDLDGNDYHFCEQLLKNGVRPRVWIQEYNSTFSPSQEWVMPYSATHKWKSTNFFGASFSSFVKLFSQYEYFPVVCNVTGSNIFFVQLSDRDKFPELPVDNELIYMPSRPWTQKAKRTVDGRILRGVVKTD